MRRRGANTAHNKGHVPTSHEAPTRAYAHKYPQTHTNTQLSPTHTNAQLTSWRRPHQSLLVQRSKHSRLCAFTTQRTPRCSGNATRCTTPEGRLAPFLRLHSRGRTKRHGRRVACASVAQSQELTHREALSSRLVGRPVAQADCSLDRPLKHHVGCRVPYLVGKGPPSH